MAGNRRESSPPPTAPSAGSRAASRASSRRPGPHWQRSRSSRTTASITRRSSRHDGILRDRRLRLPLDRPAWERRVERPQCRPRQRSTRTMAATLDADDRFRPQQAPAGCRRCSPASRHRLDGASTSATKWRRSLRLVGAGGGPRARRRQSTNGRVLSMDSMIVWGPPQDLDAPLRSRPAEHERPRFPAAAAPHRAGDTWYLGTPLHDYLKLSTSLSNGEGVTARMLAANAQHLATGSSREAT